MVPRRSRVIGFGAVSVDHLILVDAPLGAGKGKVIASEVQHGGNVATALAAIGVAGGNAAFIGYLPDRGEWEAVYKDLESYGVSVDDAIEVPGGAPIRSTIIVTPAHERFIAFDDDVEIGAPGDLSPKLLASAGALLVDQYAPTNTLRAVRAARTARVPVVGDLERLISPVTVELVKEIDHLVIPAGFARILTDSTDPHQSISALWSPERSAVVITDGASGSWYRTVDSTEVVHVPAFRVDVIDTTGCGDIFHGIYAMTIAGGGSVFDAVQTASAAAAIGATGVGGRGHLPSGAEISAIQHRGHQP